MTPEASSRPKVEIPERLLWDAAFNNLLITETRNVLLVSKALELMRWAYKLGRYDEAQSGGTTAGCATKANTDSLSSSVATSGSGDEAREQQEQEKKKDDAGLPR